MHHNDSSNARAWTRRELLGSGLVLASAAAAMPAFLQRSAFALPGLAAGSVPGVPDERILVVVQLGGGNDGLNTIAPVGYDEYRRLRPGIGLTAAQTLTIERRYGDIGFHPGLEGLKDLYDRGLVSVVQGVGYPNPNRSHFKSMDIWQTAETTGTGDGWLGRYYDSQCCGFGAGESGSLPAGAAAVERRPTDPPISIGSETPLALQGRAVRPVAFENPDQFRWAGARVDRSLLEPYERLARREPAAEPGASSNAAFLMRTGLDARVSSERIRRAVAAESLAEYPRSALSSQLGMIAKMIRAGMKTRVYYASLGGFDTHAGQGGAVGRHAGLIGQFADAVRAFYDDLERQGNAGRVLTMSFSEFGRRVAQNASGGTDHGTAAPMFLFGPMVNPGVLNPHPSLRDLEEGDLKHTVDFRRVYAGVLKDWLEADPAAVLDGQYPPAPVIRRPT